MYIIIAMGRPVILSLCVGSLLQWSRGELLRDSYDRPVEVSTYVGLYYNYVADIIIYSDDVVVFSQ